jgi:hydrogenase maturation protease
MNPKPNSALLLGLGNDIMGDDGVALAAVQMLNKNKDIARDVDISDTTEAGLALLDTMSPYDRVLILDSIVTGKHPPGTIREFSRGDFDKVLGPSPHYAGLPEVLELAKRMKIAFPKDIRVLAIEIEPSYDFRETLSPVIEQAVPAFVEQAVQILQQWTQKSA